MVSAGANIVSCQFPTIGPRCEREKIIVATPGEALNVAYRYLGSFWDKLNIGLCRLTLDMGDAVTAGLQDPDKPTCCISPALIQA